MAKWATATGVVIEKSVQAPPGAPGFYWTYIMLDLDGGGRDSFLLDRNDVNKVTIGDYIRLEYRPKEQGKTGGFFRQKGCCKNLQVLKPITRTDIGPSSEE